MSHPRFAVWLVLSCTAIVLVTPLSGSESSRPEPRLSTSSPSTVVTTAAELVAALSADPGDLTIFVQRGTYLLDHAITVPDGTSLIGEGTMLYEGEGLPTGFVPETRTVIVATAAVTGHFVTLGDGASLQGLVIQDVVRPALTGGSVVVVSSRHPSDSVSAQLAECEIINPNPVTGPGVDGPVGRGLLVMTRDRLQAHDGVAHEQSRVSVHLTHSIIRSPGGGDSIIAFNFASGSHVDLRLRQNVLGGRFGGNGGISRPESIGNLYRADTATAATGWQLQGGGDAPMIAPLIAEETLNNKLWMHSVDDRIEGFGRAIGAAGGVRMSASAGAVSSNELDLILEGTRLLSTTLDVGFNAARSAVLTMPVGDGNQLRVTMHNVVGSGPRANVYSDATPNLGIGNRLVITGNFHAFSQTNQAILPMPGEQFFTAGR
jgi:hypothetical protein